MQECVEVLVQIDKGARIDDLYDLSRNLGTDREFLLDLIPWIRQYLLNAEIDLPLARINGKYLSFHDLALFDHLFGVPELLTPGDILDLQKAGDTGLKLNESTVFLNLHDLSLNNIADIVFFKNKISDGNDDLPIVNIDPFDDPFKCFTHRNHFRGVPHDPCQGKFVIWNKSSEFIGKIYYRSKIKNPVHSTFNNFPYAEFIFNIFPWIICQVLETQPDLFVFFIKIYNDQFHIFSVLDDLSRVLISVP